MCAIRRAAAARARARAGRRNASLCVARGLARLARCHAPRCAVIANHTPLYQFCAIRRAEAARARTGKNVNFVNNY